MLQIILHDQAIQPREIDNFGYFVTPGTRTAMTIGQTNVSIDPSQDNMECHFH